MSSRRTPNAVHASFVKDAEAQMQGGSATRGPKTLTEVDYGYGPSEPDSRNASRLEQPDTKRRRYERRNSKTPQMLMSTSAAMLDLDFLNELDQEAEVGSKESVDNKNSSEQSSDDYDPFDESLVIAEQLVKQLQKRRKGNSMYRDSASPFQNGH